MHFTLLYVYFAVVLNCSSLQVTEGRYYKIIFKSRWLISF